MTQKQICMTAIERFGRSQSTDSAISEMSELTTALIKYRQNPTRDALDRVRETMAGVDIAMTQLQLMYGGYDGWTSHKLKRLKSRIGFKEQA